MDKDEEVILRARERIRRKQTKQENTVKISASVVSFLDKVDLKYSRKHDRFLWPKSDGTYEFIRRSALIQSIPDWCEGFSACLKHEMALRGSIYTDVTYTFKEPPRDCFNLLNRSRWLQPTYDPPHPAFAILMQSLGGGKAINSEHIERVLCYKYMHPECYTLPTLVIHGEGGVGKNILVDVVLHTLFDGQTISALSKHVVGDFNSLVKGKAVVLINESVAAKTDANAVKATLGQPTVTINEKGIPQYVADNTALYIIAANKNGGGGVYLDRSDADRRYSPLHCPDGKNLPYWVSINTGVTIQEARQWIRLEGMPVYSSKTEISNWLGYLIKTYSKQNEPVELHGPDFKRMMDRQKPMTEQIFESIFYDMNFTHIDRVVALEAYQICARSENTDSRVGRMTFIQDLEEWIQTHTPYVKLQSFIDEKTQRIRHTYVDTRLEDCQFVRHYPTRSKYLIGEEGSIKWAMD